MTQYLDNELTKLAEMAMEKPEDFGWWGDEEMFVTWGWQELTFTVIQIFLIRVTLRLSQKI